MEIIQDRYQVDDQYIICVQSISDPKSTAAILPRRGKFKKFRAQGRASAYFDTCRVDLLEEDTGIWKKFKAVFGVNRYQQLLNTVGPLVLSSA